MENNQEVLLKVEHLSQYFKMGNGELKAVDDVSFEIKKGEVFGLVGETGCGKTTTGRTIIRLYNATSGNVYFKGVRIAAGTRSYTENIAKASKELAEKLKTASPEDAKKLKSEFASYVSAQKAEIKSAKYDQKHGGKGAYIHMVHDEYKPKIEAASESEKPEIIAEYKRELKKSKKESPVTRIQMIFQDPIASLDPRMTVREIIAEGLKIQGEKNQKVIDEKVYQMLEYVGLVREHAGRYPHEFSGGQKQRVGVARAIIMEPELIIADEPVSALDVSVQAQVINLLNELRERLGLTILFIAHDLSVVKYFSDRIGVMYYGKLVELASSDELFLNPLHPYTRSLLSAIPLPDPHHEKKRKRITYNALAEHDYSVDKPSMREVKPGHMVYCNEQEYQSYLKMLK